MFQMLTLSSKWLCCNYCPKPSALHFSHTGVYSCLTSTDLTPHSFHSNPLTPMTHPRRHFHLRCLIRPLLRTVQACTNCTWHFPILYKLSWFTSSSFSRWFCCTFRSFSQQAFWYITAGKAQVTTLKATAFHLYVPVSGCWYCACWFTGILGHLMAQSYR